MNLQLDNSPDPSPSAPSPNSPSVAAESRFWAFVVGPQFGVVVALLALLVISFYVFVCTPYEEFVYSDMKSFWVRAMDRLAGNQFADSQFVAWPPLYHIFLAEVFRVLGRIGLGTWVRLETALLINIAAFAISVYAFQRLAAYWFERRSLVLVVVLLYAIGFPALYFNAFLLSDNLGAALLVMAISVAVCRQGWGAVIGAALLFAAAAIIRPSLGPYGLAFVALYLGRYRFNWQFIIRSALFSVLFFSAVFAASAEVSRISHGRVTGLSANGGLDFFIANADYHRVELNYDGWHFFIIVPSLSWKPEKGIFHTTVPFYNQDYYFQQGLEAIKRNPSRLWMNLEHVRNLFFADMLPSRNDAPGFTLFRPVWDWLKFGMFASLGLYFWMRRELGENRSAFLLFVSTVTLTLIVSYIFTGEPRYTYSIIFIFYLLFFKLVELVWKDWRRWKKTLAAYFGGLVIVSASLAGVAAMLQRDYTPTVAVHIETHEISIDTNNKLTGAVKKDFDVGRVLFPYHKGEISLLHADNKKIVLEQSSAMQLHTRFEVLGDKPLKFFFRTYSSWPFILHIDGRPFVQNDSPDYFINSEGFVELSPGIHELRLAVEYYPREGGLAMNYSYFDKGGRVRQAVGLDSESVRFLRTDAEPKKQ